MSTLVESILKCKVEGNVVHLPPMSDGPLENYQEVRNALLKAGSKYKRNTFVFPSDAKPFVDRLTSGESVNIKKEFQFFETPAAIAERMVKLSGINETKQHGFGDILEPSAGQGAIVRAIKESTGGARVFVYELMAENQTILKKMNGVRILGADFLNADTSFLFDNIVANPPFTKGADIDHIRKMYEVCKPGGTIVTIASASWTFGSNKKQVAFREWLDEIEATIEELPAGTFKETGTNVKAMLLVINKR